MEIINLKEKGKQLAGKISSGANKAVCRESTVQWCGNCGKPGHNTQTYKEDEELSDVSISEQF